MNAATEPRDPNAGKPKPKNGRAVIILGTDEFRANDEAIAAMTKDEELYSRAGQLVRIVHDPETEWLGVDYPAGPRIAAASGPTMRERLTTVADFYTVKTTDDGWEYCSTAPPMHTINAILDRGTWAGIRRLTTLIEFPVVLPDGSILATPGYHRQSGLLYMPRTSAELSVPDRPTLADAEKAITRLCEVVQDFPFAAEHHRSAWVASLLTPLARYAFRGCSPLFLIEGNAPGCGKGLAADVAALIVQGEKLAVTTLPEKTEEFRKRVTSILIRGVPMALFDNVSGDFGFPELDALLTSHIWQDRLLGESTVIDLPNLTSWYATGNNVAVIGDTARRVCPIRLETPLERPEERQDMAHADLRGWVRAERPQLLSDALTILRAYIIAGKPSMKLPQWGSFENWSDLIRGAIVWAGMADPWLGRADMRARTGDERLAAVSGLMRSWRTIDPDLSGLSCVKIVAAIDSLPSDHELAEMLLVLAGPKIDSSKGDKRATVLGYKVKAYADRVIGGRRIVQAGMSAGTRRWVVHGVDGVDGVDNVAVNNFQKCCEIYLEENLEVVGAATSTPSTPSTPSPAGWTYSRADLGGIM
ncbi:MAG: hypothetical protein EXS09_20830 [Gemmataceae bacterium]|nr:hypothetical protein [Gemmataceae bacterium]